MAIAVAKEHGFHEPVVLTEPNIIKEAKAWGIDPYAYLGLKPGAPLGKNYHKALVAEIEAHKIFAVGKSWRSLPTVGASSVRRQRVRAVEAEKAAEHHRQLLLKGGGGGVPEEEREALLNEIQVLAEEQKADRAELARACSALAIAEQEKQRLEQELEQARAAAAVLAERVSRTEQQVVAADVTSEALHKQLADLKAAPKLDLEETLVVLARANADVLLYLAARLR